MLAVFPVAEHGEGGLVAAIERILVIAGRVDIALVEHLLHPFIRRDGVFAIHRAGRKHGVAVQVIAAEGSDVFMHPFECRDHIGVAGVAGVFVFLAEGGEVEIA